MKRASPAEDALEPPFAVASRPALAADLGYRMRTIKVLAEAEYKLKYAESALGYLWSLGRPLTLFTVLYVVFHLWLRFGGGLEHFPLYLLLGIVFYNFFNEGAGTAMSSIVVRRDLIRRLSFPRIAIPVSITVTALMTFGVNLAVIAVFVAVDRLVPEPSWLLLVPLVLELYVLVLGLALVLATLYVSFRDLHQIWDVVAQTLLYATPIIYPLQLLPAWGKQLALVNPLAQIIQDTRAVLIGSGVETVEAVYGTSAMRLVPVAITLGILGAGIALFKRHERWLAERV